MVSPGKVRIEIQRTLDFILLWSIVVRGVVGWVATKTYISSVFVTHGLTLMYVMPVSLKMAVCFVERCVT